MCGCEREKEREREGEYLLVISVNNVNLFSSSEYLFISVVISRGRKEHYIKFNTDS